MYSESMYGHLLQLFEEHLVAYSAQLPPKGLLTLTPSLIDTHVKNLAISHRWTRVVSCIFTCTCDRHGTLSSYL